MMNFCAIAATVHILSSTSCSLAGDSIGVGLAPYFRQCSVSVRNCAHVAEIAGRVRVASTVIVSAGSNDDPGPALVASLRAMRDKLGPATRVIWIVPAEPQRAAAVLTVALKGDKVVPFKPAPRDIHPVDYRLLASDIISAAAR